MPHNSCKIFLNGHGNYIPDKMVNMMSCPTDYHMIFPCKLRHPITATHHNLMISNLSFGPKDQIVTSLRIMEAPKTSIIISKQSPALGFTADMMTMQHSSVFFEHILSNAPDVTDAYTLVETNGSYTNPPDRFCDEELFLIPNPAHSRQWGNSNLCIEFDVKQAELNVLANVAQTTSNLSANNLLCIKPVAPQGQKSTFMLSDLISDIIPKLKIFASKHSDGSITVVPRVFLDDRNDPGQNLVDCVQNFPIFQHPGDQLHELTIAGDANIVWDACRDIVM